MAKSVKRNSGPQFNIKMSSYQYRKSHCGDKTVVRSSYLHNGISYNGNTASLYWIRAQVFNGIAKMFFKRCSFYIINDAVVKKTQYASKTRNGWLEISHLIAWYETAALMICIQYLQRSISIQNVGIIYSLCMTFLGVSDMNRLIAHQFHVCFIDGLLDLLAPEGISKTCMSS